MMIGGGRGSGGCRGVEEEKEGWNLMVEDYRQHQHLCVCTQLTNVPLGTLTSC